MAVTFTGNAVLQINGVYTNDADTYFGNTIKQISRTLSQSFANGTGADQANLVYVSNGTASSTPTPLDFITIVDPFGSAVTFAEICFIFIKNEGASQELLIGGNGHTMTNFLSVGSTAHGTLKIRPGGWFCANAAPHATSYDLAAGTTDILQLSTASSTTDYSLLVIGRNAD